MEYKDLMKIYQIFIRVMKHFSESNSQIDLQAMFGNFKTNLAIIHLKFVFIQETNILFNFVNIKHSLYTVCFRVNDF